MRETKLRRYALIAVVAHVAVNVWHGLAHAQVEVFLPAWKNAIVLFMILLGPPTGFVYAWRRDARLGYALVAATMIGSLMFGVWHHFIAMNPDHVSQMPDGWWGRMFISSSWGLAVTEVAGGILGLLAWRATNAAGGSSEPSENQ